MYRTTLNVFQKHLIPKHTIHHSVRFATRSPIILKTQASKQFNKQNSLVPKSFSGKTNLLHSHSAFPSQRFYSESSSKAETKERKKEKEIEVRQEGKGLLQHVRSEGEIETFMRDFKAAKSWKEKMKLSYTFGKEMGWKIWYGFKDLYHNTLEARKLNHKRRGGTFLTRHEERFIRQNRSDLKSLVPFFLVWRIPFVGDILLPIFIAKFPGWLPSTFKLVKKPTLEDRVKATKIKQLSILDVSATDVVPDELWEQLLNALPMTKPLSSKQILQHKDLLLSLTSCRLTRRHYGAVCSVLNLGTRTFTFRLRSHLKRHSEILVKDDALLFTEGVESLTDTELHEALLERGLLVLGLSRIQQEDQLIEWLRISRSPLIIRSLLIYAHAFEQRDLCLLPTP